MGNRRQVAALGATCALLVAACAASESPSESSAFPPRTSASTTPSAPTQIVFPESLANASFSQVEPENGPCAAGDDSQVALFDSNTGDELWSFPIPRPGGVSALDGSMAYVSFRWDRGQFPGIGAIDLDAKAPRWQRFLTSEPEQVALSDSGLVVVTRDEVRSIDTETGEDQWVNNSEFDFGSVVIGTELAFALDRVGVHAIDLETGRELWELELERPDALAADDATLAVAAGPRLVAVDITRRSRLWDITVNRTGAGAVWVTPNSVSIEMAPGAAPGGGIISLDRSTGTELWRATNIGEAFWVGSDRLISSTANDEALPAQPFVLLGLDAQTGEEQWRVPTTAQAFDSVVGQADGRLVASDPHPAVSGLQRIRLIDARTGDIMWETTSDRRYDGAEVEAGVIATLYGSTSVLGADRGSVAVMFGGTNSWSASQPDGIAEAPRMTPHGLFVISGEPTPTCVGRRIGEPNPANAVLGATVQPS